MRGGCVANITLKRSFALRRLSQAATPNRLSTNLACPRGVSSVQSFDLPLVDHVHRLDTFDRSLRRVERAEALHAAPPPADKTMILLDNVRQVFRPSQAAIEGQHFLLLRGSESFGV